MTRRVLAGWLLGLVALAGFVCACYPVVAAAAAVVGRLTGAQQ